MAKTNRGTHTHTSAPLNVPARQRGEDAAPLPASLAAESEGTIRFKHVSGVSLSLPPSHPSPGKC